MRKVSLLLACAALAHGAGPAAHAQEATVEQTAGFQAIARYCLNATDWKDGPELEMLGIEDISEDERRAVVSTTGGGFRFFLIQDEPRVLLALQWEEREMFSVQGRERRPVLGIGGRCVVFAHENLWDGMAEAIGKLTKVEPHDASSEGLDALILLDTEKSRGAGRELSPWSFTVSRADGTTMYRATF